MCEQHLHCFVCSVFESLNNPINSIQLIVLYFIIQTIQSVARTYCSVVGTSYTLYSYILLFNSPDNSVLFYHIIIFTIGACCVNGSILFFSKLLYPLSHSYSCRTIKLYLNKLKSFNSVVVPCKSATTNATTIVMIHITAKNLLTLLWLDTWNWYLMSFLQKRHSFVSVTPTQFFFRRFCLSTVFILFNNRVDLFLDLISQIFYVFPPPFVSCKRSLDKKSFQFRK